MIHTDTTEIVQALTTSLPPHCSDKAKHYNHLSLSLDSLDSLSLYQLSIYSETHISQPNLVGSSWNFQCMTTVGKETWIEHQLHPTLATPSGHDLSWPSHPIKINTSKPSYHGQILMDFHEIFSNGPQWAKRYEGNINFTQPHLPKMVMTYYDNSHPIKTNSYKPSYYGQILMDLHKLFSIDSQQGN